MLRMLGVFCAGGEMNWSIDPSGLRTRPEEWKGSYPGQYTVNKGNGPKMYCVNYGPIAPLVGRQQL